MTEESAHALAVIAAVMAVVVIAAMLVLGALAHRSRNRRRGSARQGG